LNHVNASSNVIYTAFSDDQRRNYFSLKPFTVELAYLSAIEHPDESIGLRFDRVYKPVKNQTVSYEDGLPVFTSSIVSFEVKRIQCLRCTEYGHEERACKIILKCSFCSSNHRESTYKQQKKLASMDCQVYGLFHNTRICPQKFKEETSIPQDKVKLVAAMLTVGWTEKYGDVSDFTFTEFKDIVLSAKPATNIVDMLTSYSLIQILQLSIVEDTTKLQELKAKVQDITDKSKITCFKCKKQGHTLWTARMWRLQSRVNLKL
jgi:hypothetical protein